MITAMTSFAVLMLDAAFALVCVLVLRAPVFLLLLPVVHTLVSVAAMRILTRFCPVPDGEFHKGSREFDAWQARAFLSVLSCNYFDTFVPILLRAQWYRLFGANLAPGARIAGRLYDCTLVTVGSNALLGMESVICPHSHVGDTVRIGRVVVRQDATVGMRSVLLPGVTVEEGAAVAACALVAMGRTVPAGETWAGIPARPIKRRTMSLAESVLASPATASRSVVESAQALFN